MSYPILEEVRLEAWIREELEALSDEDISSTGSALRAVIKKYEGLERNNENR